MTDRFMSSKIIRIKNMEIEQKITRIFDECINVLELGEQADLKSEFIEKSIQVRNKFPNHSKFRSMDILAPYIAYFFFRSRGIYFNLVKFYDHFKTNYYTLHKNFKNIIPQFPEYVGRDQKNIARKFLAQIWKKLHVKVDYLAIAMLFFDWWHDVIASMREELVATTFLALTGILLHEDFNYTRLCSNVGVPHTSVQNGIMRVAQYLHIQGFKNVTSSYQQVREELQYHVAVPSLYRRRSGSFNMQTLKDPIIPTTSKGERIVFL